MKLLTDVTDHGATFSMCGCYRYTLWRTWDASKPTVAFVGLNPSTATGDDDDPTIRKCQTLARAWGFGRFEMLNAFAWRSTDPDGLLGLEDPVGYGNDRAIIRIAGEAARMVMAWGRFTKIRRMLDERAFVLRRLLRDHPEIGHLGLNGDGSPKHPLFLKNTTEFQRVSP